MNYNDMGNYVWTIEKKTKVFNRKLEQDEPLIRRIFEKFGNNGDHYKVQNFLDKEFGRLTYSCNSYSYRPKVDGSKTVTAYHVYESRYEGTYARCMYKDITFGMTLLKNDDIYEIIHLENGLFERSMRRARELPIRDTIEEVYQEFMKLVKYTKRQAMNHYNKEIKDLKQEYKEALANHNKYLKKGER